MDNAIDPIEQKERPLFEAHMRRDGWGDWSLSRSQMNGLYADGGVQRFWEVWKARAAIAQSAQPQEPVAWAVIRGDDIIEKVTTRKALAEDWLQYADDRKVIPLYAAPVAQAAQQAWEPDYKDLFEKRTRERDALRARLDRYEKDDVIYPVSAQPAEQPKGELTDAEIVDRAKEALGWSQQDDWLVKEGTSVLPPCDLGIIHVDDLCKAARALLSAQPTAQDSKDAQRLEWIVSAGWDGLRQAWHTHDRDDYDTGLDEIRGVIDAAIAQGEKK